jgi:hypothetical protein
MFFEEDLEDYDENYGEDGNYNYDWVELEVIEV